MNVQVTIYTKSYCFKYILVLVINTYLFYTVTGCHTIAVVKGQESYELLRKSFADVFQAINRIIKDGKLCVNGHDIPVEFYLGGDYKVISCWCHTVQNGTFYASIHIALKYFMDTFIVPFATSWNEGCNL